MGLIQSIIWSWLVGKRYKKCKCNFCKLRPVLTRATNNRLKVAKKKRRKRENIIEKRKIKDMAAKQRRARGKIGLSSEEKDENDTGDNTDPN